VTKLVTKLVLVSIVAFVVFTLIYWKCPGVAVSAVIGWVAGIAVSIALLAHN
jgi:hypothetical protein